MKRRMFKELLVLIKGHKEVEELQYKTIYLIAEPGWPNYGDEIIAREWLKYYAEILPNNRIVLDCNRPGQAAAILNSYHPNLICTDTIAKLAIESRGSFEEPENQNIFDIGSAVKRALEWDGGDPRYAAGVCLAQTDIGLVHYLGGGYMNGQWKPNLARLEYGHWAADKGINVIATGLGLTPLDEQSRKYANEMLSNFKFIGVRDQESYDCIHSNNKNVRIMPDDCFVNSLSFIETAKPEDKCSNPRLMICLQDEFQADSAKTYPAIKKAIEERFERVGECEIGVIECNPLIDRGIYEYLKSNEFNCRFYSTLELLEKGLPISQDQTWICSRYHPHLIASALGCNGMYVLADSTYYSVKHNAVHRMGSNWNQLDIDNPQYNPGKGFADSKLVSDYSRLIRSSIKHYIEEVNN